MRKKTLYSLIIGLLLCATGVICYKRISYTENSIYASCAFCDKQIINRQKFYEDDLVLALCTHKPIVPSHFLIIPKRHVERLEMLSTEEMSRIYQVINQVNRATRKVFQTSSYFIHQKNGTEVGQSVPHVHFHLIAKHPGDNSSFKFLIKMLIASLYRPISSEDMQKIVEKMKPAMESPEISSSQNLLPPKTSFPRCTGGAVVHALNR